MTTSSSIDNYLRDLGQLIREQALQARADAHQTNDAFALGRLMAYHEVVSLMQSQARAFSIALESVSLDEIEPERDLL